jgi:catechol 2,3-dioxygenase-like lactoylglutathione lyase family enzyme
VARPAEVRFTADMTSAAGSILSVTVPVTDQDRALAFYRDVLGFEVRRDVPLGPGIRWLEVAPPGSPTTIALVAAGSGVPAGVRLGTDDAEQARSAVQGEGADVDDAVARTPYAPPMFTVRDPDGNTLILIESPG